MIKETKKKPQAKQFKGDEYAIPIYTPRSTYNSIRANDEMLLNDLTLNFDPFTISILKNEFRERNGEMKMIDFIMIIKDHLIHWQLDIPNRDRQLIRCLSLLFNDIDLNGNDNMEWDEFTNYIIEQAAVLNTLKSQNEEIKSYHHANTQLGMKFSQVIKKCIWINIINKIAFFEEESDIIYFADPVTGQIEDTQTLHVQISDMSLQSDGINPPVHNAKKAMLLDIIFIDDPKYNLLVTSSNDGVIRMFKYSSNQFKPADDSNQRDHEILQEEAQMIMVWDTIDEILYSGQRNGVIRVWDQKSEPQYSQLGGKVKKGGQKESIASEDFLEERSNRGIRRMEESMSSFDSASNTDSSRTNIRGTNKRSSKLQHKQPKTEGHTSVITAMLPLNKLQFLASASLDQQIILWDTIENKKKREYKGYHRKGIMTLDFNENLILLISGGFDHEIYVWNPYIDAPVHNLTGHAAPIVSLKFVNNPLHVVSLDSDSTLKIWDVKKFKCVDTLMMRENGDDKQNFLPQGICMLEKPLKLIILGKQLLFLDYDRNNNMTSADENVSVCALFIPSTLSLLTPVGNKIKLWNLLTGEVKQIFSDITKNDISHVNLDEKAQRFMLGDTEGFVGVYNVNNGALLKSLTRHKAEIIGLIQSEEYHIIISASLDNLIQIHDDHELDESEFLRQFQIVDSNITSLAFDRILGRIIIGSNQGVISLYEATTGKGNDDFRDRKSNGEEITSMVFINGHCTIIYANSKGHVNALVISNLTAKNMKLASFENRSEYSEKPVSISQLIYCEQKKHLFMVDERYYLQCYDISHLITVLSTMADSVTEKSKTGFIIQDHSWLELVWEHRIHDDHIKSLEYIESEELLISTCVDKSVKIINSTTGELIETLRQRKEGERIKPIAYQKVESDEIYTPRMEHRIDSRFKNKELFVKRRIREIQLRQDQGFTDTYDLDHEFNIKYGSDEEPLEAFQEYEEQEFDPYYYFTKKLDKDSIKGQNSNKWNLYLNFRQYYDEFEEHVDNIVIRVNTKEHELEVHGKPKPKVTADQLKQKQQDGIAMVQLSRDFPKAPKKRAEKFVRYREKFISSAAEEEQQLLEKVRQERIKMKKKSQSKLYKQLYKQGVKKDMIKKMNSRNDRVRLSESEIEAARKLAAALASYDEDDPRNLLFTGFELRTKNVKKRRRTKQNQWERG